MIYTVQEIQSRVMPVAQKYGIKAVFLFGSYAKGTATEDSDIIEPDPLFHDCFPECRLTGHLGTLFQRSDRDQIDFLFQNGFKIIIQRPQRQQTAEGGTAGINQEVNVTILGGGYTIGWVDTPAVK